MLDHVTGNDQIECIVVEGELFRIQIGALERKPFRQGHFRIAIVYAEVPQMIQAEAAGYLDLLETDTADIQNSSLLGNLAINVTHLARRPGSDDLTDLHPSQEKIICDPGALSFTFNTWRPSNIFCKRGWTSGGAKRTMNPPPPAPSNLPPQAPASFPAR